MIPLVIIVLAVQVLLVIAQTLCYHWRMTETGHLFLLCIFTCLGIIIGLTIAPGLEQWDQATNSIVVTQQ